MTTSHISDHITHQWYPHQWPHHTSVVSKSVTTPHISGIHISGIHISDHITHQWYPHQWPHHTSVISASVTTPQAVHNQVPAQASECWLVSQWVSTTTDAENNHHEYMRLLDSVCGRAIYMFENDVHYHSMGEFLCHFVGEWYMHHSVGDGQHSVGEWHTSLWESDIPVYGRVRYHSVGEWHTTLWETDTIQWESDIPVSGRVIYNPVGE